MQKIQSMSFSDLAQDIWFEIFLRLPLDAIYKLKCVTKVWLSILSHRSFINLWNTRNTLSHPWAFGHYAYDVHVSHQRLMFAFACPEIHSQFLSHHQHGFTFGFLNQERSNLYIVGSCNGLVLCTTSIFHSDCVYYVCNPLTKRWVSLPPPLNPNRWMLYGFMCNNESVSTSSLMSTSYKVIRIPAGSREAINFKVEIFSSDLGQWSAYDVSCPLDVTWSFSYKDKLIARNGVWYQFREEKSNILAFSVTGNSNDGTCGNQCSRLIDLPDRATDGEHKYTKHCLGESEGLICYAMVKVKDREKSLSVWILDTQTPGKREDWYLLHKDTQFHDTLAKMESSLIGEAVDAVERIQVLGFSPIDKNVIIFGYYGRCIWAYNTRTKGYEQLSYPSFLGSGRKYATQKSMLTFVYKRAPTALPPVTWRDTSTLDVQI